MSFRLECKKKRETDNAVLVIDVLTGEEVWIPLSQVDELHFDKRGDGYIVISDWIAQKKGLG